MSEPYIVVIDCEAGSWRLTGNCWERTYHEITWGRYATAAEAWEVVIGMLQNPTVRRASVKLDDRR